MMLAMAATVMNAQDFTANPAVGSQIKASDLESITLTWPEGTEVSVDEWSAYMEIKTLESYEADMSEDIFWSYVGYAFGDTWEVNGSSVTIHPDYYDITEDGTYVVYLEYGSFVINGKASDVIVLQYDVVADGAPKVELVVEQKSKNGNIVLTIPEGYTLSSVAEDAQIVITDGEDYVCNAEYVGSEGNEILLAPSQQIENGSYYVSVMDGTFVFNDGEAVNAYIYSRFSYDGTSTSISAVNNEAKQNIYNLHGMRMHKIGRGLHVVNGKVVLK